MKFRDGSIKKKEKKGPTYSMMANVFLVLTLTSYGLSAPHFWGDLWILCFAHTDRENNVVGKLLQTVMISN